MFSVKKEARSVAESRDAAEDGGKQLKPLSGRMRKQADQESTVLEH